MAIDPFFIFLAVSVLIVAAILIRGIANFARGGDAKKSNKLMQWRIIAQFVAVVVIILFVLIRRGG